MRRKCNTYVYGEYKFLDFTNILDNIRDSFSDDMDAYGELGNLTFKTRFQQRYLKHSVLTEILMASSQVDPTKTNVIIVNRHCTINSGELFDATLFIEKTFRIINTCKRNIPLLIKMVDCDFSHLHIFLGTGEGEEFLLQVDSDREKLKKSTCSFRDFKKFVKKNGLRDIAKKLINKIEFKRLFFS
jgi:hypothetical protein